MNRTGRGHLRKSYSKRLGIKNNTFKLFVLQYAIVDENLVIVDYCERILQRSIVRIGRRNGIVSVSRDD